MNEDHKTEPATDKVARLMAEAPFRWLDATGIILGVVGLIGGLGYYLDYTLATKPWFMIAGIVIAFPLSQYLIYRRLKSRYKL